MGKKRKDRTPETAYNVGGESSSTSKTLNSSPEWNYDVFLSFAGKDSRFKFTDHLYDALRRGGINAFRDDEGIERGQVISQQLRQAIKGSLCAVVVLSENYADSKWCLEELQLILKCRRKLGQQVYPIFYDIDPKDVRRQRQNFGDALDKHEKKFGRNKAQKWRNALSEIGSIAGWDTRGLHEAELIKVIVGKVRTYLSAKLPSYDDNLVGIELRVRDVETILGIGLDDKRGVGIWGMGGVGKTTLARVVYKKISCKFEGCCCFIANVRDTFQKEGLVSLQKKLLSDLNIKDMEISSQYEGEEKIRKHLSNKKVLVVLDDVDDMSQLKYLAESPDWFGKGSRILITTRDSHLLTVSRVQRMYDMKTMNEDESLKLFSKKAFKEDYPKEDYLELSKSVIEYAGGLPLALEVLGSYLLGRSRAEWRDVLDRLKQFPDKDIVGVLQISYDGLNEEEKAIFLDIACCFKGWPKKGVTQILKSCDLHPTIGMKVLIEKALLVETKDGKLEMHDLIEELGRHIVHQESPKDVCKRSRLWKFKDIKEVLENNKEYGEIEAIVMENKYWNGDKIEVHPEAFSKMSRLRLLLLDFRYIPPTGLEKLSGALKCVGLLCFPLGTLPNPLDELVPIEMQCRNIDQLWNSIKSLKHLKLINVSYCRNFTETSDFSNVQSLGHLYLFSCHSLVKVHESLGVLKGLVVVDLSGCEYLSNLPSKLETNSLRKLDLGWCKRLKKLPEFGEGMKKLEYLDASHTGITTLPKSLGTLTGLRELNLSSTDLYDLPTNCFSSLSGLVLLSLGDCNWLESLPRLPPRLIRLEAGHCYTMKRSLDEQMLNLVTSLDHECRGQTKYVITDEEEENMPRPYERDYYSPFELKDADANPEDLPLRNFFAIMPSGGKIPSWFDSNIKYYKKARTKCEIEVVVPPHFRASKWSGIVVCLHIKGHDGFIRWSSKAPEDDEYNLWEERARGIGSLYWADGLCVMVLEFNQKSCWQHLRGDNNFLHIQLASDKYPMIVEDDVDIVDILGCGWRVICKEDIQNWGCPNHFNQFTQPQHASPSKVTLPWRVLHRLLGVSVKPRMMSAHSSKNLNKRKARHSNKMAL